MAKVQAAADPRLPDELLEEIFLRLEEPGDLVRASAVCASFRRIVTERRFLRRLRSIRPPPVLGLLGTSYPKFLPAEPPHRSAPAARAADITFDFLPASYFSWRIRDVRDARVLLSRYNMHPVWEDLMVCDPLHRRYVHLPRIPDDLTACVRVWSIWESDIDCFLDPSRKHGEEEDSMSFGVICVAQDLRRLVTFHFSSATAKWQSSMFNRSEPLPRPSMPDDTPRFDRFYAHSCFFWSYISALGPLFVLDTRDMKLSVSDCPLPQNAISDCLAIVEAGEGKFGLFIIGDDDMLELYTKTLDNNGDGFKKWQYEKPIPFPETGCYWCILSAAEGYVLLEGVSRVALENNNCFERQLFILDPETLQFQRLGASDEYFGNAKPYANFPLSLSLPSM